MLARNPHPDRRVRDDRPFVGRGLRDVWSHFTTELEVGIRKAYPVASASMNQVMMLIDREGTNVSELARRASVTKQAMAESVANLEGLGLVSREPDPRDRRARLVVLTNDGWTAIRLGLRVANGIHERWTGLLGDQDMTRLLRLLERLADRLDAAADL